MFLQMCVCVYITEDCVLLFFFFFKSMDISLSAGRDNGQLQLGCAKTLHGQSGPK